MRNPSQSSTVPAATPVSNAPDLDIATFSYEERRVILPAIIEALEHSGAWLLDRKPASFTQMEYHFELHSYAVLDLYAALIAAGLELTRASHDDLTALCAVRQHNPRPSGLPSLLSVRLLVSFLEDLAAGMTSMAIAATA